MDPAPGVANNLPFDLKVWAQKVNDFQALDDERHKLIQTLLLRVEELHTALAETKADLEDQISIRRTWRKRAEDVEDRVARSQYVMTLIDGNKCIFGHELFRGNIAAANDVSHALFGEIRDFAKSQHKSDLAESFQVLVHVLVDVAQLEDDLLAAGMIDDRKQVKDFFHALSKTHPLLMITDCGRGREAVDAKLKELYELFIENCHCRHLILGLGHDSKYYQVLHSYADDEYTKRKTSLIRPPHGLPSQYNLPFAQADISYLGVMPLISITSSIAESPALPQIESSANDLFGLDHRSERQPDQRDRSMSSAQSMHSSAAMSMGSQKPKSSPPSTNNGAKGKNYDNKQGDERPDPRISLVKDVSSPKKPFVSRSYQQQLASSSKMEAWEMDLPWDNYTAPPDTTPWDASQPEWQPQSEPEKPGDEHREPYRRNAPYRGRGYGNTNTWRADGQASLPERENQIRQLPVSYQGSWDDRVEGSEHDNATTNANTTVTRDIEPIFQSLIYINTTGQRIDAKLPRPSSAGQAEFEGRAKNKKLCNGFHIAGTCPIGSACHYDHTPISAAALSALRHAARKMPCNIGPVCRRPNCFMGHHCPYGKGDGMPCSQRKCAFQARGMHCVTDLRVDKIINPH